MKSLILSLFLLASLPLAAEMYKWVDDKGNVHFSDKPVNKDAKTYNPPPIPVVQPGPTQDFSVEKKKEKARIKYKVSIASPTDDQVFPNGTKVVTVRVGLEPSLAPGHMVIIFIDGKQRSKGTALAISEAAFERGTHTASAKIIDEKGKTLITSDTISFHVQRHHI